MPSAQHRDFSPYRDDYGERDRSNSPAFADFTRSLRGLVDKFSGASPDPTNPVVDGASQTEKPWLRGLLADMATQIPRTTADIRLIASIANSNILNGGLVDDKTYQMEQIVQLASSLPTNSRAQTELANGLIGVLWQNLQHPPLSLQDPGSRYRTADGSNNNLMYPNVGKAGSPYARTVTPKTLQPGVLPDPGVVFDAIFARDEQVQEHPNRISSMMFYLASIIIHDCFHTDPRDSSKVKTSSYLDLAPLYGSSVEEQTQVRAFKDGLLKPDTFSERRILGFPPGVSALLICFNRYHNYVAIQLKAINEGGRFTPPSDENDKSGWQRVDENLFQTARLVTCGLYVNIILHDYVRTILNLNRTQSTWTLDPRENGEIYDASGVPRGIGNQVSVEFNLVYRWHSATSVKDAKWTQDAYQQIFPGRDISKIEETEFVSGLRRWLMSVDRDPSQWQLDFGRYQRNERGAFKDQDLVRILTEATEDVACAFGARQVPVAMRLIEIMGIRQAREWQVATLNEFRRFFSLEPHKEFSDISRNPEIQDALKALYKHPDYVELYPGLVAEDAKDSSYVPGSGICLGYTASRTILSDAVALVRGDRFYTIDNSPKNLTNWGFNQIRSDPDVAQGHCIHNLIMRALPNWYRGNSVYAMFPFVVPDENRNILENLGTAEQYHFLSPSAVPIPKSIKSWDRVTDILGDKDFFKVPWGEHISYLTGHDNMLGNDTEKSTADKTFVKRALYCPANGLDEIRKFYEVLTRQLIVIGQEQLREKWFQLDICRDVAQPAHSVFVAKLWHIPLKEKSSHSLGIEVDQMYLAMSLMFAYVFLDADTTRSFKLRKSAKEAADKLTKLCKITCKAVETGEKLHLSRLFHMGEEGQMLESYGRRLISRMFDNGWDVDTVVANLLPVAVGGAATQAQHMTQMIDLYLSDEYSHHWDDIRRRSRSDDPADFEILKSYALEANRLAPATYGLLRRAAGDATLTDKGNKIHLKKNDAVYLDFLSAGLDEKKFPEPRTIKLDRPRDLYIHHGWGMHSCLGRAMVEVAMAAQLKVFAQLKNLRRAPGPQGQMKFIYPTPNPVSSEPVEALGHIKTFMKEDWSDFWPFPTSLKVHHDGFHSEFQDVLMRDLMKPSGYPAVGERVMASSRENSRARSRSRSQSQSQNNGQHRGTGVTQGPEQEQLQAQARSRSQSVARHNGSTDLRSEFRRPSQDTNGLGPQGGDLVYGDEGGYQPEADEQSDRSILINGSPPPKIAVNGDRLDPQMAKEMNGHRMTNGH